MSMKKNDDMLRLAGLLNENEFGELPTYGDGIEGMNQRNAFHKGVYIDMTRTVKGILELALKSLDNPEWNREEDSPQMLAHLEGEIKKAIEKMERSQRLIDSVR